MFGTTDRTHEIPGHWVVVLFTQDFYSGVVQFKHPAKHTQGQTYPGTNTDKCSLEASLVLPKPKVMRIPMFGKAP